MHGTLQNVEKSTSTSSSSPDLYFHNTQYRGLVYPSRGVSPYICSRVTRSPGTLKAAIPRSQGILPPTAHTGGTLPRARASATLGTVGLTADGGLGGGRNAFSFSSAPERNERPNMVAARGLYRRRSPCKADVASSRCHRDRERFCQRRPAENVPRANSYYRRDRGRFWPTNMPAP